ILPVPSVGLVVVPVASTQALTLRLLTQPADTATPVTITSRDPSVVTATAAGEIAAGSRTAVVTLTTGAAGQGVLTLQAGGEQRQLTAVVGTPTAGQVPPVLPDALAVCILPVPSVGLAVVPVASTQA